MLSHKNKAKIRKFLSFTLLLYIFVSAMVFICETADARAGGGHSYSSGRGGSSSSGGGGDAIFIIRIVEILIRWCIEDPGTGIPVTLLVIGCVVYFYFFANKKVVDNTITRGNSIYNQVADQSAWRKIKAKDPNFSEETFKARAKTAFNNVQKAWCFQNLNYAEAFLADGTYEQFQIQINLMKERKVIDVLEKLSILSTNILNFESDGKFDAIHLSITAQALNYRKDAVTDKFLEGDRSPEIFSEVWTFMRRTGAKTKNDKGLIEGFCPNCGTPIEMGRNAKCSSCGSVLRSGEHDWVLSNITQACEWTGRSNSSIPGVRRYMATDPGFNVQHIEDRVSLMFWRKNESERLAKADPMRKIATEEFCKAQLSWYAPDANGATKLYTDVAVGGINVLCADSTSSATEDYVLAKVIWSGIPTKKTKDGKFRPATSKINIKSVFVLKRLKGVKTDIKNTLVSGHCPYCGAPETDFTSNACAYCQQVMNDGKKDWVLDAVLDPYNPAVAKIISLNRAEDSEVQQRGPVAPVGAVPLKKQYTMDEVATSMNSISGMTLLKWTTAMMLADGVIDKNESIIIYDMAKSKGITADVVDRVVAEIKAQKSPVEYVASSTELPMDDELMRMLIRVAYADGKIAKNEVEMLKFVGRKMNLTDKQIQVMLAEERTRMYRMAKAVIKESKSF